MRALVPSVAKPVVNSSAREERCKGDEKQNERTTIRKKGKRPLRAKEADLRRAYSARAGNGQTQNRTARWCLIDAKASSRPSQNHSHGKKATMAPIRRVPAKGQEVKGAKIRFATGRHLIIHGFGEW